MRREFGHTGHSDRALSSLGVRGNTTPSGVFPQDVVTNVMMRALVFGFASPIVYAYRWPRSRACSMAADFVLDANFRTMVTP